MANEIKDLFKKSSKYDSKHINNLSTKKVPEQLLAAVENGCSLETLQELAGKKFPICKYQTQITVHGIFEEPKNHYIGGYKNLTRNKNKSLGIRWTAIDRYKKTQLFKSIKLCDNEWIIREDSQQYYMEQMHHVTKEEYATRLAEMRQKAESINTSLFTGWAGAYGSVTPWGSLYVVLNLTVQCFPVENMQKIIENVTCKDAATIKAMQEAETARRAAEKAQQEAKYKAEEEERQKAEKERQQRLESWRNENPVPACFKLTENHTFQPGDIEAWGVKEQGDTFAYRYRIYSKSFGRLIHTECDITGKKIGKGTEAWRKTAAQAYIKAA